MYQRSSCSVAIQWYPGHMTVARREAAQAMESVDVIVEVVDARVPEASSNPVITDLRLQRQRPCLKVLNKADLADPSITQAWLNVYNQQANVHAVALSCLHPGQAATMLSLCQTLAPHRNSSMKPLRMFILGVPNVGKSTLMNCLLKRRLAKVGNEPAVTKVQQRHILNDRVTLIDSPGLLWPKIEDPVVGLMLAVIHSISAKVVVDEELAEFLADMLLRRYPALLASRYGYEGSEPDGAGVLEAIARKRGCLKKGRGGEFDREKAAKILLTEFRNGTLGRISLETPPTGDVFS
ncbi:MAG: ribosome biogenesis GTPase YlqF [Nitrospira sp.]|nr:ribosome biogenesis GTPase YlqF [Nitrospira sp.]